jgi:hypothetical protein
VADTEKLVLLPEQTVELEGLEVMKGKSLTVRVAELEVAGGEQIPESMHL